MVMAGPRETEAWRAFFPPCGSESGEDRNDPNGFFLDKSASNELRYEEFWCNDAFLLPNSLSFLIRSIS